MDVRFSQIDMTSLQMQQIHTFRPFETFAEFWSTGTFSPKLTFNQTAGLQSRTIKPDIRHWASQRHYWCERGRNASSAVNLVQTSNSRASHTNTAPRRFCPSQNYDLIREMGTVRLDRAPPVSLLSGTTKDRLSSRPSWLA